MLIREVILENFMSYEYARVPLKPGLNIICGPNGSGKSSILLAISVALGQAYTERSRRLSDLIRWGEDSSRVTLVFDNSAKDGKRPVPRFNSDHFRISRYLKDDGTYWFEVNFKTVNKNLVIEILNEFGINPDNMLIIMHQRMMEEFGITSATQRLSMVEEAVGLGDFRRNVLEAQDKLDRVLSQEESVRTLFDSAEQTLAYWKEEYEKYLMRMEIIQRKKYLERELVWSELAQRQGFVEAWASKVEGKDMALTNINKELEMVRASIQRIDEDLNELRFERRKSFYALMALEKERTECQVTAKLGRAASSKVEDILETMVSLDSTEMGRGLKSLVKYNKELNSEISASNRMLEALDLKAEALHSQLTELEEKLDLASDRYVDKRVKRGLLSFQRKALRGELDRLEGELRTAVREVEALQPRLEESGAPVKTSRTPQEVSEDIRIANIRLSTVGEASEDVERMYLNYLKVFNELKERAKTVSENREEALKEVEERRREWRRIIRSLLEKVKVIYQDFLSKINARGNIRLVDSQDMETAGLELTVGFKGAEPAILDSYTQSGGERSASTMAFLLALQQYVRSPFRAVDEFDIHMDPRNRETISELLHQEIKGDKGVQYLTITPGQIRSIDEDVHFITVQNVEGRSELRVLE